MLTRQYKLQDGRVLCALIELDMWSLWIDGEAESHVVGAPLTGVLMEVLGLNPAHDEPDEEVTLLARSIQEDFPGSEAAVSKGAQWQPLSYAMQGFGKVVQQLFVPAIRQLMILVPLEAESIAITHNIAHPPNNGMEPTVKSDTPFAKRRAKGAPLLSAAHPWCQAALLDGIVRTYRYLFYRYYSWLLAKFGESDGPQWSVCLGLSLIAWINLLSLLMLSSYNVSFARVEVIGAVGAILLGHFFYFIKNERFRTLRSEFALERPDSAALRAVFVVAYPVASLVLFGVISGARNGNWW